MKNLSIEAIKETVNDYDLGIINSYLSKKTQKQIIQEFSCKRGYIDTLVQKYKLTRFVDRKRYTCKEDNINKDNPLIWYFLGLFASDGNYYMYKNVKRIQFTIKDEECLIHIKNILGFSGEIKKYIKSKNTYFQLMIHNTYLNNFVESIIKNPIRKTNTLVFPSIKNKVHLELFLRGYFDGDGSFTKNFKTNRISFVCYCHSEKFAKSLQKVLKYFTDSDKVHLYKNKYVSISQQETLYKFIKNLYTTYPEICLKRKKERALELISYIDNKDIVRHL